jgi:Pregnancy-associated plasma protein-A/Secretion system C-terminal sorting domain
MISSNCFSQTNITITSTICGTSEAMNLYFKSNTTAKLENQKFELFTSELIEAGFKEKSISTPCFIIPVVFHVYGTTQGGKPVNDTVIQQALDGVNRDFHAMNSDFNSVHSNFKDIRGQMPDVTFALAKIDPNGNHTNGIDYRPSTCGYAIMNSYYDSIVASQAWNNYKYLNIYVMNDLCCTGCTAFTGFAHFPDTALSNKNLGKIGFNGIYLGKNTTTEKASILTHEFGHWLNLYHTFQGACINSNDYVADTPPCDNSQSYGCHYVFNNTSYPINCNNNLINAENYMDYAGFNGCYKMFTQGQVNRMYAALYHPARQPLWQPSNLIATGLSQLCSSPTNLINYSRNEQNILLYPNPNNGEFKISSIKNSNVTITNELGQTVKEILLNTTNNREAIIDNLPNGIYLISGVSGSETYRKKIVILK